VKKKLIEVALPLDAINAACVREKSIRHGHPSTLHLWWARRPLAACRAVLFAQLVDDPSAHPEEFPGVEAQEVERQRLFRIIEELVKWENTNNEEILEVARVEIRRSCDGEPPAIVDPFAGGGSIPLEAQRLGLEAHASDLNPVAVLINKALIEIPPRWSDREPVHASDGKTLGNRTWAGAQGLADDVRFYGQWMRDEAEKRIGQHYPKVLLPDDSEATVIAWIWARTVTCPNPACGATMPLVKSFWLSKKKGKEAWVNPIVEGTKIRFEIGHGAGGPPLEGTVSRQGAICIVCDSPVPFEHIREAGQAQRIDTVLMAVVAAGDRSRIYLGADLVQVASAEVDCPSDIPLGDLPINPRNFNTPNYGLISFSDLFTNRQLTALSTFSDLVGEARTLVEADAKVKGINTEEAKQYADDVGTYLAFLVDKSSDYWSSLCGWNVLREQIRNTFGRQALPMVWDFAETNVFSSSTGNWMAMVTWVAKVVESLDLHVEAHVSQASASDRSFKDLVVCTDPPYYDNIGYADLSDFFYVWLRRSLREVYPDLLGTLLTPKAEELIATPYRFGGSKEKAKEFFEDGFVETFTRAKEQSRSDYPMTIFYAFKQTEVEDDGGVVSTGWETMLEGLSQAGLMVTGTWPMRTEKSGRMIGYEAAALASSIVLVCRARPETAGITDRAGFLATLRFELPPELEVLQKAAIAPVDLAQAAIGPGMAVYSRYAKIIEPSGESMRVRTALGLINQVLSEVIDSADGELDADTRWAVKWFEQRGMDEGPFGEANLLATALGVSVEGLVESGILRSGAGKVRLLERDELPEVWNPVEDERVSVWEATQHLVKALSEGGETAASDLLVQLGGIGDAAQLLSYRLYAICERKGWSKEGGPYNELASIWGALRASTPASAVETNSQGSML